VPLILAIAADLHADLCAPSHQKRTPATLGRGKVNQQRCREVRAGTVVLKSAFC